MKQHTKKTLINFWRHSLRYKWGIILSVTAILGASMLNVVVPLYFKKFFDLLTSGQLVVSIVEGLVSILVTIAVLRAIQWLCWRVATFTANSFQSKIITDLVNDCFAFLHRHSFGFFIDNFVGSLVKKVKWFGRAFEVISDRLLWDLLPLVANVGIIIYVLSRRDYRLALGVVAWLIIFLIVNGFFVRYKLRYDVLRSQAETRTTGFLADTITNQSTVKLFGGYRREVGGFGKISEDLRRLRKLTWDLGSLFEAVQGLLMTLLEIAILFMAIRLWQKGILTVGDFVLIQAYLINIFARIWDFGKIIRQIYESLADAEEMTVILETPHEITDAPGATALVVPEGRMQFQRVDFNYRQTRQVFKRFTLEVLPHERLALVGPSGAGKTTLIKLLVRMHDVTAGRILIDGQDIVRVTQQSLRKNISLVPQDPILFHRSLLENIRYGRPEASDEEVIAAAKAAHCHEFISSLTDGYQTYVGERGVKLSSGERQRVAIARAILYNAPILVLDEATSSLDSESERLIQDALDTLMVGKTVIAIAHRLSTIKRMDRIVVIDSGIIVEEGSHQQLVQKTGGLYQHLWKLQAGGFI